jgi:Fe-S cluster assembly protein SufD
VSLAYAIRARDPAKLPSKRDEDWRWTDLRGLIREVPPPAQAVLVKPGGPFAGIEAQELAYGNGAAMGGVGQAGLVVEGEATWRLRFVSEAEGTAYSQWLIVNVLPGAKLTVLESYEGEGRDYLANIEITYEVAEGASVTRIVLADEPDESVLVSTAKAHLHAGASFDQVVVTSGGRRQRLETRVDQPEGHAKVKMDGVYLLSGKRHADITTVVRHEDVEGVTEQLVKGVVRDQARGIFQGRIVVAEGADRTDARMGHHALILSDRAEVDAKPELEIYADDVACAHGNTIGALDEEALFYARQRGIPEPEARALLTEAFVGEVVDRIAHEGAREAVRAWVAERLA